MTTLNEHCEWLLNEVDKLQQKQAHYEDRAFLLSLKSVINEQNERSEQIQNELDGRLWNHTNW
ncbi:hypothetical protein [Companilactobacillus mishanensis]|uniref:Uncharacterized protein n=1 Tax=Companilactobacillus mishanensis TaxID=2486008 RepID=A0ABW9P9S5_9LACO|nr:hypothetical protein [Companilactobacillus mishanensis]MQS46000.1 hypothetical protein [Companilactobacillus mishanensis]